MEKRNFSADGPAVWPIFRWSQDDKYFARIGSDVLSVYETPVRVLCYSVTVGNDI
jgi:translation initiation factor 3 subunit B